MKKTYLAPSAEYTGFTTADIITVSVIDEAVNVEIVYADLADLQV